jgi:peroxiredoxin
MNRSCIGRPVRRLAAVLALGALAAAGCSRTDEKTERTPPPRADEPSPNVTIKSYETMGDVPLVAPDGTEYRLSHFRGNIVVLCVFATWNDDCVAQIRELNGLHDRIKNQRMTVIGVALDVDGPAAVKRLEARQPISFPVFTNGAAIVNDLGGVRKLPTTYVLLRERHIYHKAIGFQPGRHFDDQIRLIRAQRL